MRRSFLLILSLCLAWGLPAFAEDAAPSYELGEIVVSGKQSAAESVGSFYRITAARIEESGARNLSEAVDHIPGIYVRTAAAGVPRIDIRGQRTRHVRLLLNGVPLNNTYDRQFDPSSIPVENIAEIKVSVGTGSVLYGPGGSAGVINIITKKGSGKPGGTVMAEVGSDDRYTGRATLSGAGDRVDGFISAGVYSRGNTTLGRGFTPADKKLEDGGDRENSDYERMNLFTGVGYTPTDNLTFGLTASYVEGEEGVPHAILKKDDFIKEAKFVRRDDIEDFASGLAVDYKFAGPFELRGWGYFNQNDVTETRYDDDSYTTYNKKKKSYRHNNTSQVYGLNLQLNYVPAENHRLSFAVMMEENTWDSSGTDGDLNRDLRYYTMALEYNLAPMENLDLVMGYGHHFMDKEVGDDEDDYSCMLGATYEIVPGSRIKASASRNVTFPSVKQLYDGGNGSNPDLNAELTYTYELGLEQALPADTLFSITGFIKDAEDFIEKNPDSDYENFEEYRFKGVEVGLTNSHIKNLTISASYAYLKAEDKSSGSLKDELQNRPAHKFYLETRFNFPFGLKALASLTHVADQYYYSSNLKKKERLKDITVVDVKVSQMLMDDTLEVFARAENLLNELYEQSYAYPADGRSVYFGVKYTF